MRELIQRLMKDEEAEPKSCIGEEVRLPKVDPLQVVVNLSEETPAFKERAFNHAMKVSSKHANAVLIRAWQPIVRSVLVVIGLVVMQQLVSR
jgi:hypothetical protein